MSTQLANKVVFNCIFSLLNTSFVPISFIESKKNTSGPLADPSAVHIRWGQIINMYDERYRGSYYRVYRETQLLAAFQPVFWILSRWKSQNDLIFQNDNDPQNTINA